MLSNEKARCAGKSQSAQHHHHHHHHHHYRHGDDTTTIAIASLERPRVAFTDDKDMSGYFANPSGNAEGSHYSHATTGSPSSGGFHRRALSFSGSNPYMAGQGLDAGLQLFGNDIVLSPLDALVTRLTTEYYHLSVNQEKAGTTTAPPAPVLSPYIQQFSLISNVESGSLTPTVAFDGYFPSDPVGESAVALAEGGEAGGGLPRRGPERERESRREAKHPSAHKGRDFQAWVKNILTEACRVSMVGDFDDQELLALLRELGGQQKPPQADSAQPSTPIEDLSQFHKNAEMAQLAPLPQPSTDTISGRTTPDSLSQQRQEKDEQDGRVGQRQCSPSLPRRHNTHDPSRSTGHAAIRDSFSNSVAAIQRSSTWDSRESRTKNVSSSDGPASHRPLMSPITPQVSKWSRGDDKVATAPGMEMPMNPLGLLSPRDEPGTPMPAPIATPAATTTTTTSSRGIYRARDPAAPHRRPVPSGRGRGDPAKGGAAGLRNLKLQVATNRDSFAAISPARLGLLRAVGRRHSIRLAPDNGCIVVADAKLKTGTEDALALPTSEFEYPHGPKRSSSLSQLPNIPETRRVSYTEELNKAARPIMTRRLSISRRSRIHKAVPIVAGRRRWQRVAPRSREAGGPSIAGHGLGPGTAAGGECTQAISAKPPVQLVITELPPPVPLRVRREKIAANPEPIIAVRRPAPIAAASSGKAAPVSSSSWLTHERALQNQMLGALAQLLKRTLPIHPAGNKPSSGILNSPTDEIRGFFDGHSSPLVSEDLVAGAISDLQTMTHDARPADGNPPQPHPGQLVASQIQLRSKLPSQFVASASSTSPDDGTDTEFAPGEHELPAALKRWRSTRRRRSTLRTTILKYSIQSKSQLQPHSVGKRRSLLLHGPAYKVLSSLAAQTDTYLFLFTDALVVTRQSALPSMHPSLPPAMNDVAPSADASTIPKHLQFRVQVVIPLSKDVINLTLIRASAAYRPGETEEQQDARLTRLERTLHKGCEMFSRNPSDAIIYLIKRRVIQPYAEKVAGFLYRCVVLDRRQLANFIGFGMVGKNLNGVVTKEKLQEDKQYHRAIWRSFLERCQLQGLSLLEALRVVLQQMNLPIDAAVTNTMLEIFAVHWFEKNRHYSAKSVAAGPHRDNQPHQHGHPQAAGMFKRRTNRKDKRIDTHSNIIEALNCILANEPIWVPDSVEVALKLAFWIVTIGRSQKAHQVDPAASERDFREFVSHFRVAMVGDQAQSSRKENVLRKRDQPRVTTVMEVPLEELTVIWENVRRFGLHEIIYSQHITPEFDVAWVRDTRDMYGVGLSETEIQSEIEEVYSDAGHKDGLLMNPSSDRIPAKVNLTSPYYLRVTIKLPKPDPKIVIGVRVCAVPSTSQGIAKQPSKRITMYGGVGLPEVENNNNDSSSNSGSNSGGPLNGSHILDIQPSPILQFQNGNATSFVLVPRAPGHVTLQFIYYGERARCYASIPSRTVIIEGDFMLHSLQLSWAKPKIVTSAEGSPSGQDDTGTAAQALPKQGSHSFDSHGQAGKDASVAVSKARYMFGFDSDASKSCWASMFQEALGSQISVGDDVSNARPVIYDTNPNLSPSLDTAVLMASRADTITRALNMPDLSSTHNDYQPLPSANTLSHRQPNQPILLSGEQIVDRLLRE